MLSGICFKIIVRGRYRLIEIGIEYILLKWVDCTFVFCLYLKFSIINITKNGHGNV